MKSGDKDGVGKAEGLSSKKTVFTSSSFSPAFASNDFFPVMTF